jgi:hypothetical protein
MSSGEDMAIFARSDEGTHIIIVIIIVAPAHATIHKFRTID